MKANCLKQQNWDVLHGEQIPPTVNICGDETYARPRTLLPTETDVNKCPKQYMPIFDSRLNTWHDN